MEMQKTMIFAFRGDPMCFIHVLLNGLDMQERGLGGEIVVEGDAVRLIPEIAGEGHMLHPLYNQARQAGILQSACKACSNKLGVASEISELGLDLVGDMKGHPSMGAFIDRGYRVITF